MEPHSSATTLVTPLPTIIVCGLTGSGKSSVVNMLPNLAGCETNPAAAALASRGVTKTSQVFHKDLLGQPVVVIDTPGIGEGADGTVPTDKAVEIFYRALTSQPQINLIVHVMKGARINSMEDNMSKLIRLLCGPDIPVLILVTLLDIEYETLELMQDWAKKEAIFPARFRCKEYACIVPKSTKRALYAASRDVAEPLLKELANVSAYRFEFDSNKDNLGKLLNEIQEFLIRGKSSFTWFPEELRAVLEVFQGQHNFQVIEVSNRIGAQAGTQGVVRA